MRVIGLGQEPLPWGSSVKEAMAIGQPPYANLYGYAKCEEMSVKANRVARVPIVEPAIKLQREYVTTNWSHFESCLFKEIDYIEVWKGKRNRTGTDGTNPSEFA